MAPPFRADHVGSLLRPRAVLDARAESASGRIDDAALRRVEDVAIQDAIRMQEEVGLEAATDGELRRAAWHMDFLRHIAGVEKSRQNLAGRYATDRGEFEIRTVEGVAVTGKLRLDSTIFGADFAFLKANTRLVPKLTIPSPSMLHFRAAASVDPAVYPQPDEFLEDLAAVYADEIDRLAKMGCTYLQLDDTSLAMLNDPAQRARMRGFGGNPERQHIAYIRLINAALARRPAGMTICVHLCRGNFRSGWMASGGYDHVADALFGELSVDGYFMEYDDERSGGFAPLRFVPKGKRVVLGLVTSKRPALEDKDVVKRRIDEAARYVPLDQLCLSPQCGFASTVEGNEMTPAQQRAKLALVVEIAREVWG
jgi:methionine synthase II (cobalamin-independent)